MPVVQHAHHVHPLTPLITYSNEHFSPGTPPSHLSPEILDPKTGKVSWMDTDSLHCSSKWKWCCTKHLSVIVKSTWRICSSYFKAVFTFRYSSDSSSIGALSILPLVSWCCWFDCTSSGLAHATVSSFYCQLLHSVVFWNMCKLNSDVKELTLLVS